MAQHAGMARVVVEPRPSDLVALVDIGVACGSCPHRHDMVVPCQYRVGHGSLPKGHVLCLRHVMSFRALTWNWTGSTAVPACPGCESNFFLTKFILKFVFCGFNYKLMLMLVIV